jgi:hypothetical protein
LSKCKSRQDVLSLADRIRSIGQAIQPVLPLLGLFALGILAIVSPGLALKLMIVGLIAIIVYLVVNWNNLTMSQKVVLIVIAALIAAIIVLTTVQLAFNAAMLASPITWIILGIVALIAIIVLLATNWDKVKAAGANAWAWIKNAWNTAANWFNGNVIQPVAGFFGWLWDSIKYGAAQAWQGLKDGFRAVMNFIIDGINLFISTALAPFNLIISGLNKIPNVNIPYLTFSIPHIPRLATAVSLRAQHRLSPEKMVRRPSFLSSETPVGLHKSPLNSSSKAGWKALETLTSQSQFTSIAEH